MGETEVEVMLAAMSLRETIDERVALMFEEIDTGDRDENDGGIALALLEMAAVIARLAVDAAD